MNDFNDVYKEIISNRKKPKKPILYEQTKIPEDTIQMTVIEDVGIIKGLGIVALKIILLFSYFLSAFIVIGVPFMIFQMIRGGDWHKGNFANFIEKVFCYIPVKIITYRI
jgi:hypothetical protein